MQYADLIFTNHAQAQIKSRGIKIDEARETLKNPDVQKKGKFGGFEFKKKFEDFEITVVAIQNKKNEWIIKSVWRDPPLAGTIDAKQKEYFQKYKKAGFWGKLLLTFKNQLGV